jgi:hypothetical protein
VDGTRPRAPGRAPLAALGLALHLLASPAAGQSKAPPDEATRNAARTLAAEGDTLFAKGDYAGAEDRFARGFTLVPAPTIGVRWARALARQGKLIAAEERYVAAVRLELGADAPSAFRTAVDEATRELAELRTRIPKLAIVRARGVGAVRLDGKEVPDALLGVSRPVDPGEHVIEADNATTARVTVAESESKSVDLAPIRPAPEAPADDDAGAGRRTAGWVAIGFGGIALGVGIVGGVLALGAKGTLDDECGSEGGCPPEHEGDLDTFRTAGAISTIGFVIGTLGIGTGVVLVLTAPDAKPTGATSAARAPSLRGWVGLGRAGVSGSF